MTEMNMEERIAIRDSARSLKKYGSTSSNTSTKQEYYLKHQVEKTDTLQGLALKYGVTTEQIRRANKLWANDSIFLRSSLLIPTTNETVTSPNEVVLVEADPNVASSSSSEALQESYNDFLVKIDCSIASTKSQVMMSQDNSQFTDDDCLFVRRKGAAMSRLKQQQRSREEESFAVNSGHSKSENLSNGSVPSVTELPTVVMTQGKKVRSSLQRLQQTQDSLFEL